MEAGGLILELDLEDDDVLERRPVQLNREASGRSDPDVTRPLRLEAASLEQQKPVDRRSSTTTEAERARSINLATARDNRTSSPVQSNWNYLVVPPTTFLSRGGEIGECLIAEANQEHRAPPKSRAIARVHAPCC